MAKCVYRHSGGKRCPKHPWRRNGVYCKQHERFLKVRNEMIRVQQMNELDRMVSEKNA